MFVQKASELAENMSVDEIDRFKSCKRVDLKRSERVVNHEKYHAIRNEQTFYIARGEVENNFDAGIIASDLQLLNIGAEFMEKLKIRCCENVIEAKKSQHHRIGNLHLR